MLKATNVLPSPQYALNIYNDNRQQTVITKEYQEFLYFRAMNEEKILEYSDGANLSS